ncbi:hypothetical protein IHV10_05220 [Fictibacillus sp. 5RED26]|jgi:hypothetical protein|uniref:hypothetical protein n=1 Tax=Fictibacillus TaxID=1329200 RepID=UPI0018CD72DE|nr:MULTISPECIES: hypothetical protein [unclassified Fictibacillus]MBH0155758.1 hypothetical protein [Fictibacillus sp. 5RED26]MBH0166000.1 hypothetical protein [Fictibacillus sp. 7GRE50]MBH0172951.1 hypothetical protein [Fictibacillus sp. 23RED33]
MKIRNRRIYAGGLLVIIVLTLFTITKFHEGTSESKPKAVEVSASYPIMDKDWAVNYHVKKQRIYFENIISRFSFQGGLTKTPGNKDGYIAVFVNNKWKMNANQSMFILKNMNPGKHKITLQLKKKDGSDYGLKKNIVVQVR